jgi:hypothetical protein
LVERVMPPRRSIDPDDVDEPIFEIPSLAGTAGEGSVALSGRTRHNKLVHLAGDPGLVGHSARVHLDHAGPFALRGRLVAATDVPDVLA